MESKPYDLLILGGGCAGLTAAIYAGRAGLITAVVEKQMPGGQAALTGEVANYPGFKSISGAELSALMAEQAKAFGAELVSAEATGLELGGQSKRLLLADGGGLTGRAVILACGANPKKLGFPGENEFFGRGVSYCATCDGFFFKDKEVLVIGGGYSAAEEALYLTRFAKKISIAVRGERFRCARTLAGRVLNHPKIETLFHTEIVEAHGGEALAGARLKNNHSGKEFDFPVSGQGGGIGIFVFVGYQPSTALLRGHVELDAEGYVPTNERMETGVPGVFAAGDLRSKHLRQLVTAASDGAVAATQAEKYLSGYQ